MKLALINDRFSIDPPARVARLININYFPADLRPMKIRLFLVLRLPCAPMSTDVLTRLVIRVIVQKILLRTLMLSLQC